MSTHMPGFHSSFRLLAKLDTRGIRVKTLTNSQTEGLDQAMMIISRK